MRGLSENATPAYCQRLSRSDPGIEQKSDEKENVSETFPTSYFKANQFGQFLDKPTEPGENFFSAHRPSSTRKHWCIRFPGLSLCVNTQGANLNRAQDNRETAQAGLQVDVYVVFA